MKIQLKHLLLVFIFVITCAVYANVFHYEFINMDDDIFVSNNPYIQQGITARGLKWAFTADLFHDSAYTDYWQPVTFLVRMAVIQFFGVNPHVHHGINILLHALSAVILFLILLKTTNQMWQSIFVALAFALHPIQLESVCWVTNLKGILSILFAFSAIWFYVLFVKEKKQTHHLLAVLFMALGAMSKPMIFTLPALLLLMDAWPLYRAPLSRSGLKEWKRLILEKRDFFIVSAVFISLAFLAKSTILRNLRSTAGFWSGPHNFIYFIWRVIYPTQFAISAPFQKEPPLIQVLGAFILLIWISAIVIQGFKKRPYLFTGWFWFLIGFLPIIFNTPEDRYAYFSIIGIFLIVGWGIPDFLQDSKLSKPLEIILPVCLLGWYAISSHSQTIYWESSETLFEHSLAVNPDNARAYNNLASAYVQKGDLDKAIDYYTKALWLMPGHAKTHNNLALILADQGKTKVAKFHFKAAIQTDPMMAEAYINLAGVLVGEEKYDEAVALYQRGLQIDPENYLGLNGLGGVFVREKEYAKAIPYYLKELEINPTYPAAHHDYGLALARLGRIKEATEQFTEAIRLNPSFASAHNKLGVALALQGRFGEAVFHLQECLKLDPYNKEAEHNLELLMKDKAKNQVTAQLMN